MTLPQAHFYVEVLILVLFECVNMNLDTGAAANTCPSTLVQMEQEMEDSIEQPVVDVSLMVELGSFKDTMITVCSNLSMEDSLVFTKCCAVLEKSRAKDDKISIWDPTVVS